MSLGWPRVCFVTAAGGAHATSVDRRSKGKSEARARRAPEAHGAREGSRHRACACDLCLALPNTKETPTWEKPHFRVGERIFAGCGDPSDPLAVGFKLTLAHARRRYAKDARFKRAAYVGKSGWVTMNLRDRPSWVEVRALIEESYRLVADMASVVRLDALRKGSGGGRD